MYDIYLYMYIYKLSEDKQTKSTKNFDTLSNMKLSASNCHVKLIN